MYTFHFSLHTFGLTNGSLNVNIKYLSMFIAKVDTFICNNSFKFQFQLNFRTFSTFPFSSQFLSVHPHFKVLRKPLESAYKIELVPLVEPLFIGAAVRVHYAGHAGRTHITFPTARQEERWAKGF